MLLDDIRKFVNVQDTHSVLRAALNLPWSISFANALAVLFSFAQNEPYAHVEASSG